MVIVVPHLAPWQRLPREDAPARRQQQSMFAGPQRAHATLQTTHGRLHLPFVRLHTLDARSQTSGAGLQPPVEPCKPRL